METRSRRQQASQRPTYPQVATSQAMLAPTSSTASSAFQSSSSLASIHSPNSTGSVFQASPASSTMYEQRAPFPSPLPTQSTNYFGSINNASVMSGSQQAAQLQHSETQQRPRASIAHSNSFVGQRGDGAGAPETAPFLDNFNLVAEAAKRAEMACLMRDMGDVEL